MERGGSRLLTQINRRWAASPRIELDGISTGSCGKGKMMFDSSEFSDELQALKGDLSRLLNTTAEGIFDSSRNHAEELADQIKAALSDLGETLGEQEEHVEQFISERPIAALASAFALGAVIGFMLRRH
jgi:ElaB/YqjD/DUF883 family membrane-anchored ribosome-binding protein